MTDKELIRKAHEGNKDALNVIIEKYYDDIFRFCLFLTGNESDSYDITQETFLRFISYVDSYQHRNLKGYLLTIAHNLCRDYFSHKHSGMEPEKIPEYSGAEQQIVQVENRIYVLKFLKKLPKEQREIIILRIYEEMKFKDIAKMLGSNLSTVKSRYRLGLANMKKNMEKEDAGYGQ